MKLLHPDFNLFLPRYWFGRIDSRPLSVFRIAFALLLLKNALYHIPLAHWFFSDDGLVPRAALWDGLARINRFSLMDTLPYAWESALFFVVWVLILVLLAVGWRTRWMAVLNFVFIVSVHERNLYILTGADTVMRVLAFWAMFVPLAQHYSIDAVRARWQRYLHSRDLRDLRVPDQPRTVFAFPVRMLQLQVVMIYVFTWALKMPGYVWQNGDALHYALQLQTLTLPTGDWVRDNVPLALLRVGSWFSLVAEGLFAPLVLLPFFQPLLRKIGLALTGLMHLGIAVLMAIQDFSILMWISYLPLFLPSWITGLGARLRAPGTPVTLPIPAGRSPLWLLLAVTREDEIRVYTELRESGPEPDVWWLDRGEGDWISGAAAWRGCAAHLPLSRIWGRLLGNASVRRTLWTLARLWIVRTPLPDPLLREPPVIEEQPDTPQVRSLRAITRVLGRTALAAALGYLMVFVIWWNVGTLTVDSELTPLPGVTMPPDPMYSLIQLMGIWQHWGMFSPFPSTVDGWITIVGRFENGQTFDLRTGLPRSDQMPRIYFGPDNRWKKYEENLNRERPAALLEAWGRYYCRAYNDGLDLPSGQRLATLEIEWNYRRSVIPGTPANPLGRELLWRHWCFDQYAPQG